MTYMCIFICIYVYTYIFYIYTYINIIYKRYNISNEMIL